MSDLKVRVKFVTKYPQYAVSDTPFAVPSKLGKSGLSKVVNHLLGNSIDDDEEETQSSYVAFDFIIAGHLIRMPLDKIINRLHLSTEELITIEYFPGVSVDSENIDSSPEMPAWVGCLSTGLTSFQDKTNVVTGCYDGTIRFVDVEDGNKLSELQLDNTESKHHNGPIKSIKSYSKNGYGYIISAGKDHKVNVYQTATPFDKKTHAPLFNQVATLEGHLSSVECMDTNSLVVVSGDWNGNIFGFKNIHKQIQTNSVVESSAVKKRKVESSEGVMSQQGHVVKSISSDFHIHAHSQAVSDVHLYTYSNATNAVECSHMVTSSWDHSMKIWDLEYQDNIRTYNTGKVVTSVDYSVENRCILLSQSDGKIKLYDNNDPTQASRMSTDDTNHMNTNNTLLKTFGNGTNSSADWISKVCTFSVIL